MSADALVHAPAPANEADIIEAVVAAHAAGEPLLIQGNGSKSGLMRPVQAARSLSHRAPCPASRSIRRRR